MRVASCKPARVQISEISMINDMKSNNNVRSSNRGTDGRTLGLLLAKDWNPLLNLLHVDRQIFKTYQQEYIRLASERARTMKACSEPTVSPPIESI